MTGRRTVIGLSLVVALLLSAIAAQGASAEQTAFECIKTSNATSKFLDAHCLEPGAPSGGAEGYKHKVLPLATSVPITLTNAKTANKTTEAVSAILFVKNFLGTETEITCATISGTGTLENVVGPPMKVIGAGTIKFTNCKVNKPANKCKVREPIETEVVGESRDGEGFMSLKLSSKGEIFTKVKFEDKNAPTETCAATFKAEEFPVTGFVEATANGLPEGLGATSVVTPAMSSLKLGASTATLSATATFTRTSTGNALTLTTPPYTE